jgi:hypothetical protein
MSNDRSPSMSKPIAPKPMPPDLLNVELASLSGAASHRAGFALGANPYASEHSREARMSAWAFTLGWREQAWLAKRAKETRAA